jgi:transposase
LRDLPSRFGHLKVVHKRLWRWCESGVLERIFSHLSSESDNENMMIDATIKGDSHVGWFEGSFSDYREDEKRRLGADSVKPKQMQYRQFTR